MKINDIEFYGFTRKELKAIRKETGKTGEEEANMEFIQKVADAIGTDVTTIIQPGGRACLVKAGE